MTQPSKILIVEDEAIIAMELESRLIQMGYHVIGTCASGAAVFESIAAQRPDIILMDIHLQGGKDGIALSIEIEARFDIPIVYLTAHSDEATLQRAKATKPYGYLLKPFRTEELHATVEMALHRHQADAQVQRQAIIDPLTDLYNRRFFDEVLIREFYLRQRIGAPLSLAMLDIDHFKRVNDDYGHAAGDLVLKTFAGEMLRSLRRSDMIFRYGGEEFAIIFPDTPLGGALCKLERIREHVREIVISHYGIDLQVTLSAGVAGMVSSADYPNGPLEMLQAADKALYRAKQTGRDRVCVA
jgi:diguanylate cyclase (GGDEF)-like protein